MIVGRAACIAAMIFLLAPIASAQTVEALLARFESQDWRRDIDGPVVSLGRAGAFDDAHLLSPCVALA